MIIESYFEFYYITTMTGFAERFLAYNYDDRVREAVPGRYSKRQFFFHQNILLTSGKKPLHKSFPDKQIQEKCHLL